MSVLAVRELTKRYPGAKHDAVHDLSLRVEEGEVLALVGESGSGKTTFLRMISGLETPSAGEIEIGDKIVCGPGIWVPPEHRGVGLVFQDYALFPHLTVARNVAYGLARRPRRERRERAREVLDLVGLEGHGDRFPHELSGGQQQRVALARALAPEPTVVLLDEPFSNLDAALKARLRDEVGELIRRTGTTAVFVLHDSEDALALGDRIAIMRDGTTWQCGTPQLVYACPRDGYVARFFGETNLLPAHREPRGYQTPLGFHPTPNTTKESGTVTIALYPEELELRERAGEGAPAAVVRSIFRGSHQQLTVRLDQGAADPIFLQVHLDGCWPIDPGTLVQIRIRPSAAVRVLAESELERPPQVRP
jgi:iron(III) transport system ATP-binding protein